MRGITKAFMISSRDDGGRSEDYPTNRMPFYPNTMPPYGDRPYYDGGGMGDVENRFRDRRGRQHYDNGRFAPMRNAMDEDEPQMRSVRPYRGDGGNGPMSGGYDEPNMIGFRADGGHLRMVGGEVKHSEMQRGHANGKSVEKMDKRTAEEWTGQMHNTDGTRGAHWTMEQTSQVMQQRGIDCDPVEFFVAMNMLYSDYAKVAKMHGVNSADFYADMAKAFLDDKDAQENKLSLYYECIVK